MCRTVKTAVVELALLEEAGESVTDPSGFETMPVAGFAAQPRPEASSAGGACDRDRECADAAEAGNVGIVILSAFVRSGMLS